MLTSLWKTSTKNMCRSSMIGWVCFACIRKKVTTPLLYLFLPASFSHTPQGSLLHIFFSCVAQHLSAASSFFPPALTKKLLVITKPYNQTFSGKEPLAVKNCRNDVKQEKWPVEFVRVEKASQSKLFHWRISRESASGKRTGKLVSITRFVNRAGSSAQCFSLVVQTTDEYDDHSYALLRMLDWPMITMTAVLIPTLP